MELASRFLTTGPTGKLLNQDFLGKEQFPLWPDHRRCVRSRARSELGGGVTKTLSPIWLLRPRELKPARLLCPWDSPGKNTEVGCHFLLQGIWPRDRTPGLLHCRQILYWLSYGPLLPKVQYIRADVTRTCLKLHSRWLPFLSLDDQVVYFPEEMAWASDVELWRSGSQTWVDMGIVRRACFKPDCWPPLAVSVSTGLGEGLRICAADKFLGPTAAGSGSGTTLWEALF